MNITAIPFHHYLGIELAEAPNLLQLKSQPHHANHLGTIHASVLIALAEAASGLFLMQHLRSPHASDEAAQQSQSDLAKSQGYQHDSESDDLIGKTIFPIIRRIDAKFHQAGRGTIYARSTLDATQFVSVQNDLEQKHRARVHVPMQVVDANETVLLSVTYDWFIKSSSHQASVET